MRVFALTFGAADTPSTHFRIHQYSDALRERGVTVDHAVAKGFEDFDRLDDYDLVLWQKTLLSTSKARQIRKHARALIYDADDRIWLRPGKDYDWLTRTRIRRRLRAIVSSADLCIAANGVIAGDQRDAGASRVEILPMSIDTNVWNAKDRPSPDDTVTIGWSGAPGNLPFLEPLVPALRRISEAQANVRIAIHCGRRPDLSGLDFVHHPFVSGEEPDSVRTFDIGLLPLPDDPFVQGKSPIKTLQYFASGVAVVGQDVGATAEFLQHDVTGLTVTAERTWQENLRRLIEDTDLRARLVRGGQELIAGRHTMEAVVDRYVELLDSTVEATNPRGRSGRPRHAPPLLNRPPSA